MLTATTSANHRFRGGSVYENTPDTAYAYTARADGQAASVTFRPDTAQSTSFTTTYGYDANQHLTSAQINDGRPRRVEYVNDAQGQVLVRREADNTAYSAGTGKGGDPRAYNYYLNGIQVGSNSNNGNPDPDFGTALGERVARPTNGTGAFVGGADGGSTYADFDQAFDAVNASNAGNGTARYTVRSGDSLQSIAASLFGDASLWYIIGEANGLTSTSALSAGQSLTIPGKIANFHNNADTFRPYDASKAIGDTAPTTPRPPKKANGCGVFGQILLAAIAIAVTAIIAPAGAPLLTQIGAAVAGSVASQGVGLATGIQDKFSFKGVALAALSAGIGGGGSGAGIVGKVVNGAINSAITQGIAVAVGLQDKFSFAGVAAAGIAAGVGGAIRGTRTDAATRTLAGAASAIAGAGARSLVTGTSFGDNIRAILPDIIGQTVGGLIAEGIAGAGARGRAAKPDVKLAQNGSGVTIADPGPLNIPIDLAALDASLKDTLAAARVAFGGAVTAAQTSALVNATSAGGANGGVQRTVNPTNQSALDRSNGAFQFNDTITQLIKSEPQGLIGGIKTSLFPNSTVADIILDLSANGKTGALGFFLAGRSLPTTQNFGNPLALAATLADELPGFDGNDTLSASQNLDKLRAIEAAITPFGQDVESESGLAVARNLAAVRADIFNRAPLGFLVLPLQGPGIVGDILFDGIATGGASAVGRLGVGAASAVGRQVGVAALAPEFDSAAGRAAVALADTPVISRGALSVPFGGGIKPQGLAFEDFIANKLPGSVRLPANFKTFDLFDPIIGKATSIKTLNTQTASRINKPEQIFGTLKGNIDATIGFESGSIGETRLLSTQIRTRELQLAIPFRTSEAQLIQIERAIVYGATRNTPVKVIVTKVR